MCERAACGVRACVCVRARVRVYVRVCEHAKAEVHISLCMRRRSGAALRHAGGVRHSHSRPQQLQHVHVRVCVLERVRACVRLRVRPRVPAAPARCTSEYLSVHRDVLTYPSLQRGRAAAAVASVRVITQRL